MAYKIQWYIENHVLYTTFLGETSIEELRRCLKEINALVDQSDRPLVHVITDVTRLTKPLSLVSTTQAVVGYSPSPRTGWSITVGEQDKLVRFVSDITRQILKLRQRSFKTVEESLAFLKDIDSTIDWSRADTTIFAHAPDVEKK